MPPNFPHYFYKAFMECLREERWESNLCLTNCSDSLLSCFSLERDLLLDGEAWFEERDFKVDVRDFRERMN